MRLIVLPEAEEEARQAAAYLEQRRIGLGGDFSDQLGGAYQDIESDPERYSLIEDVSTPRKFRYKQLDRFRYIIIFEVSGDEARVMAVAHTSRQPGYWLNRLD